MVVNNWIAANLIWITLVITIIVLIYLVFTIIQATRKKRRFVSQLNIILLILGLMFLIFLTYRASEIEGADWGQIILMIGLVAITEAYASSAEKQADASVKMAETMTRPYILLRLDLADDVLLQWDKYQEQEPSNEFNVIIRNAGSGPAKNLEVSLWSSKDVFPSTTKGYLAQNEEWKAVVNKLHAGIGGEVWLPELKRHVKRDNDIVITVKYQDILNHTWASYLYLERHDLEAFVMDGEQNIVEIKKK